MAIEYITSDLVDINGYFVEIRDRRDPDFFDLITAEENRRIEALSGGTLEDMRFGLRPSLLSHVGVDPRYVAYNQISAFIGMARQVAEERSVSYRNFNVGAAAYAVSEEGNQCAYLFGANNTPYQGAPKDCAEMDLVEKAKPYSWVVAFAVFGPPDNATVNTLATRTLHPCSICRQLMTESPQFTDETLMIGSSPDGDIELMFVGDLLQLHQD